MESSFKSNLTDLSREEKLLIWLLRNNKNWTSLGRAMGMTGAAASKLCRGKSMPTRRHAELVKYGVPKELLPPPLDIKPGPKCKSDLQAQVA